MESEKKQPDDLPQEDYVDITLDDGTSLRCDVVAIFPVHDKNYIALLPERVIEGYEENDVFLYRYTDAGEGADCLGMIESDEEYETAADAFDELLDNEAFEEM